MKLRKESLNEETKETLKQTSRKIRIKVNEIKNRIWKDKGKQINESKAHHNTVKLWRQAKSHDSSSYTKSIPLQCPSISNHFQQHFSPDHSLLPTPQELIDTPDFIKVLQNTSIHINEEPPSRTEIIDAINQLNNGKSTLDIEAEIIKLGNAIPELISTLEGYFKQIWTKKEIPDKWKITRITPIWKKKGSATDPSKYRGISIESTLSKVGINIILKRLSCFYDDQLLRTQFGFRRGVGCNDGIYMVKQVQEVAIKSQRKLYICFVDLTAAFDHVNRKFLFQTIRMRLPRNQASTNIDIIENLYKSTKSYLKNENPETQSFPTESGVRQGSREGPPLYNLYSDFALRVYKNRKTAAGIDGLGITFRIPNEATNRQQREHSPSVGTCNDDDCGYADDGAVMCWSEEDLQTSMTIFFEVFAEYGLTINLSKTETMIVNWNSASDGTYPNSILSLNGHNLINTKEFKYLGVWITYNDMHIGQKELEHRVTSAHNAFAEYRQLMTNKTIKLSTRCTFLKTLVRSRLTYGCHSWRPNQEELSKLNATYRFFLRSMVRNGHARVDPSPRETNLNESDEQSSDDIDEEAIDWRYVINNQRLHQITATVSVSEFYEEQQANWVSHVIRRNNNNVCKELTFNSVKRTRLGRKIPSILERAVQQSGLSSSEFLRTSFRKENRQVNRQPGGM